MKASTAAGTPAVGLVFDGDGDRIAAVDETGRFCSTQLLMPLLIDHLARARQLPGAVVKTVSGSDLMRLVAEAQGARFWSSRWASSTSPRRCWRGTC